MRYESGQWKPKYVALPSGETVRVYIGPDKSMKQKFTELFGKKLKQAFLTAHADAEIHFLKNEGTVTLGWERVAQVRPKADKTCTIWWVKYTRSC